MPAARQRAAGDSRARRRSAATSSPPTLQGSRSARRRCVSSRPELRENRMATTDGRRTLRVQRSCRPAATPSRRARAATSSCRRTACGRSRPGKPLEILDGQTVEKVDFAAPRRRHHRPHPSTSSASRCADAQVDGAALSESFNGRPPARAGRASGDDQRHRRVPAVRDPARPATTCLGDAAACMVMGDTDDRSGYAPTYFPGTTNMAGGAEDHDRHRADRERHRTMALMPSAHRAHQRHGGRFRRGGR